jgi:mannose-6-phosphate isomerase-like protein (cupin superfamily)
MSVSQGNTRASNAVQFEAEFEKMASGAYIQAMSQLANFNVGKKAPMKNFFTNDKFNCFVNFWEPGQENTKHYHYQADNVVILVQGKGTFLVGDEMKELKAVSFIHVPRGVVHHFRNTGRERMVTVHVYGPPLTHTDTVKVP